MIVEALPLFSRGLAALIASQPMYSVVGEVSGLDAALELVHKQKPALAVVDLNLKGADGLDIIKSLKTHDPDIIVLALSMYEMSYYSERILNAGAKGYIMKNQPGEKVMEAIKTVMGGKVYIGEPEYKRFDESAENATDKQDKAVTVRELSDRQFQVFSMVGKGLGTIEMSAKLNLSTKTIETHKEHLKQKFCCNSSQELRQLAVEWNSHCANIQQG